MLSTDFGILDFKAFKWTDFEMEFVLRSFLVLSVAERTLRTRCCYFYCFNYYLYLFDDANNNSYLPLDFN